MEENGNWRLTRDSISTVAFRAVIQLAAKSAAVSQNLIADKSASVTSTEARSRD